MVSSNLSHSEMLFSLEKALNFQTKQNFGALDRIRSTNFNLPELLGNLKLNNQAATRQEYQLPSTPIIEHDMMNVRVQNLLSGLKKSFNPVAQHLVGMWFHGSLGTLDYTNYSDVDALLILRDEVLENPLIYRKVQIAIKTALCYVLLFDPLQHHGFFVGFESIFSQWPADYLPWAALQYARPIWPLEQATPTLTEYHNPEQDKLLFQRLIVNISQTSVPQTLYQAKSLLSQFMLLPTAYCQAIGHPVYKRESFALLQAEFQSWWHPMAEASRMRYDWPLVQRPLWPFLLRLMNPWLASRIYRPLERKIPNCSTYPDWGRFIEDMKKLAKVMKDRLSQVS